jgi:ABC-2 type transport system ATP-binding protein
MDYRAWGTVGRAIDFVRGFYPDWDAVRSEELQFKFGLHRAERVDSLSFGERIKLALVLALSRDPELLVLDEPTLGLDAIARRQLFTELLRFMKRDERTILISSHQLADLERFADHAAIMNRGRLLACGRMDELIERFHQLDVMVTHDIVSPIAGVYVVEQQGNRARLMIDRAAVSAGALDALGVEVITDLPLTLEDIFLTLIQGANGRSDWWPRVSAA